MTAFLLQAADTLSMNIPSFAERSNFTFPLIVLLLILMFFLLVKSFESEKT